MYGSDVRSSGHWGNFYEAEDTAPRAEDDNPVVSQQLISPGYVNAIGVRLTADRGSGIGRLAS